MALPSHKPRRGRPPRQQREDIDTRTALVRSGTEVLTEQGFTASGIDGILKRVGVPKGSFYYYFSSKEAFGQAVLEHYGSYFAAKLDHYLLDEAMPPLRRIEAFAADARVGMQRHDFRRGCLVGNLGQEVAGLPPSYRPWLQATLRDWQQRLERCLNEAQARGDIAPTSDCCRLAEAFWIGWEGAVMRARLERDAAPLDIFVTVFLEGLPR